MSPDLVPTSILPTAPDTNTIPDGVVAGTETVAVPDSVRLFSEQLAQLQAARRRGRFTTRKNRGACAGAFGGARRR